MENSGFIDHLLSPITVCDCDHGGAWIAGLSWNQEGTMAAVKDPVCGMTIDSETAAGRTVYEGQEYFFCSTQCKRQFDQSPAKYHEPRFTKKGPIVAPKFGSAGSGGLEYEPGPDLKS